MNARVLAQLEWDPNGPPAGSQGGSGDWTGSNGGTPWWNGGANVAWADGSDALFGSGSGVVTSNGVIVDDISFGLGNGPYTLSGSITLGLGDGIHSFFSSSVFDTTISASLGGTGELVVSGSGKIILSGANSFSGPTSINAGTLVLAGGNPILTGSAITVGAGSSLVIDPFFPKEIGSLAGVGSIALSNQLTSNGNNASTTFSGSIGGGLGGSFVKSGTGVLTLSGSLSFGGKLTVNAGTLKLLAANNYGGATEINSGILEVSGGNAIPDQSTVGVAMGGLLRLLGSEAVNGLNGAGAVMLESHNLSIGGGFFPGSISGAGSLAKFGGGALVLTGMNSFTGGITVNGGIVFVPDLGSNGVNGPLGPGPVTLSGGGLGYSGPGTSVTDRPIAIGPGGGTLHGGGGLTLGGLLSGPGKVTVNGGTVTFANPGNSFTGGFSIGIDGTLSLPEIPDNVANSTLGGIGPIIFNGGRLRFTGNGSDSSDRPLQFDLPSNATIEVGSGGTLSFSSASGTAGLNKAGPGTLILTNPANSFAGDVFIQDGTLVSGPLMDAGLPSALGTGSMIGFGATGQLSLPTGVNGSSNRSIFVDGGRIKISNSTISLSGEVSGDGDLTFAGDNSATDTFILSPTYPLISGEKRKGKTVIDRSTVRVAGGEGLPAEGRVELADNTGAHLDFMIAGVIGSLQGGGGPNFGRVTLSSGLTVGGDNTDSVFAGIIQGNGGLTIKGTPVAVGSQTLSGNSTFTGTVLIDGGRLVVSDVTDAGIPGPLGAGATVSIGINNGSGGTLTYQGTGTDSTNRSLHVAGSGAHLDVTNPQATLIWSGPIDGQVTNTVDTAITKKGVGTLRLTGVNSYNGSTAISAGRIELLGGNALPDGGRVSVFPNAALQLLSGANETIGSLEGDGVVQLGGQRLITGGNGLSSVFDGLLVGSEGSEIEKRGAGNFTLTNISSSFAGGVWISAGGIAVPMIGNNGVNSPIGSNGPITLGDSAQTGRLIVTGAGSSSSDRPVSVSQGGGIVEVSNPSSEVTLSGSISGTGSLFKLGKGRLRLQGEKAFPGTLLAADGTLRVDGNIPGTNVTVFSPAVLDSSTSGVHVMGPLTLQGGSLSPGSKDAPGTFQTGRLNLNSGMLEANIMSATPAGYDQLDVTGSVTLEGTIDLEIHLGFDPEDNVSVFRLVANDGSDPTILDGGDARFSYSGRVLEEGDHFLVDGGFVGQIFEIRYGLTPGDNDIRLIAVPESGVSISLALGVTPMLLVRRRRK